MGDETVPGIKIQRMGLRMQIQGAKSPLPGIGLQPFEDGAADTTPTPFADHGHAADMAIGQQPSGADWAPFPIQCQRVH